MSIQTQNDTSKKTTGWFAFRWIAGLFAVMFIVNAIFLNYALRTHSGEQDRNAYELGRNYNAQLERDRQKEALGWSLSMTQSAETIRLSILDRDGDVLVADDITALLFRPTDARADIPLNVTGDGFGTYFLTAEQTFHGQWDLKINLTIGENTVQFNERIITN